MRALASPVFATVDWRPLASVHPPDAPSPSLDGAGGRPERSFTARPQTRPHTAHRRRAAWRRLSDPFALTPAPGASSCGGHHRHCHPWRCCGSDHRRCVGGGLADPAFGESRQGCSPLAAHVMVASTVPCRRPSSRARADAHAAGWPLVRGCTARAQPGSARSRAPSAQPLTGHPVASPYDPEARVTLLETKPRARSRPGDRSRRTCPVRGFRWGRGFKVDWSLAARPGGPPRLVGRDVHLGGPLEEVVRGAPVAAGRPPDRRHAFVQSHLGTPSGAGRTHTALPTVTSVGAESTDPSGSSACRALRAGIPRLIWLGLASPAARRPRPDDWGRINAGCRRPPLFFRLRLARPVRAGPGYLCSSSTPRRRVTGWPDLPPAALGARAALILLGADLGP